MARAKRESFAAFKRRLRGLQTLDADARRKVMDCLDDALGYAEECDRDGAQMSEAVMATYQAEIVAVIRAGHVIRAA